MRRCAALLLTLLLPAAAAAEEVWSVLPLGTRGVDLDTAATFRDLLIAELGARNEASFVDADKACTDVPCARSAGRAAGAGVVVFGQLAALGQKIVVTVTAAEVEGGPPLSSQRISVDSVEDLEAAAARIATAILKGEAADDTGELGTITDKESQPDRRREGDSGLSLRIGGLKPFGEPLDGAFGIMFDLGYWYEARDFSIEPSFGYRGAAESNDDQRYDRINFDIAAHYILLRGDFAPYVGLGGGLRWIREARRQPVTAVSNNLWSETSNDLEDDSGWGPGVLGRVGLLLFRTYTLRVALNVQYDVTFVDLHGESPSQAVEFGIGVIF